MEDAACAGRDDAAPAEPAGTLGSLGEAEVLRRIFPLLPASAGQLLGPGDDAAVVAAPDGSFVVTTDLMVHGPDFRWAWSRPHDVGWKAAASNLSDVAAMGARPTALVVAIAAPASTDVERLEGIATGLKDCCEALAPGCGVVGGDLSVSETFTIAVTAFGDLEGRSPVLRSGARAGDVVAVSGELGLAGRGLRLLFEQGVDASGTPDHARAVRVREAEPEAVAGQLAPSPPIADGARAARAGATAMIDLSDGLGLDASRVAAASGVALAFDSVALGPDPAQALAGGEDHSLLACFPRGATLPGGFRLLGRVVEGEGVLLDWSPASTAGWDPYRGWDGRV